MPRSTACRANQPAAPKWLLLCTEANPIPAVSASSIASRMARRATTWPGPLPPSTVAVAGPVCTTWMSGRVAISPRRIRST
jgi:hypothetical protein